MVGRQDDLKSKQEVAMEALRNRRKKENKKEELKGFLPLNKNYSGYAWFVCNECGFELANVFKQDITSFTCTNCGAVNHRSV